MKKGEAFAALRIADFRYFVSARFSLTLAIQMQALVMSWDVYSITKSPLSLGLLGLAEAAPFMLMALLSGHWADRYNRKFLGTYGLIAFLVCSALLYFTSFLNVNAESVWIYYLCFGLVGIGRGLAGPSWNAILAEIVPKELYPNSASWNSTLWQIAAVSGPALGGLIYGFAGAQTAYIICLVLAFISILCFSQIRYSASHQNNRTESIFESLKAGFKFVFSKQVLIGALTLDMFGVLFGGAVALLPVFADKILHIGPEALGILRSAPAIGAVVMALILAFKPPVAHSGKILLASVALFGLCIFSFALSSNYWLSFALLFLSGAFDNVSVVIRATIIQLYTPNHMRGRVSSINSIFIGSSNELGALESGVAAKLLGLVPSVLFGSSVTIGITGIAAYIWPKLRLFEIRKELEKKL